MLSDAFDDRVPPFDWGAARAYADIVAKRRSAGRTVLPPDCQVAAIARCRDIAVATRNVRDFEGTDIAINYLSVPTKSDLGLCAART